MPEISSAKIESSRSYGIAHREGNRPLFDEGVLSNSTVKRVVQSMSVPLKEATRKKWIAHNPMDGVESIVNNHKERGIYSIEEIRKILDRLYMKGTIGVTEIRKTRCKKNIWEKKPQTVKTNLKPYQR